MKLAEDIRNNWKGSPIGYCSEIKTLSSTEYPAWTVKTKAGYGVAIPIENEQDVSEHFSSAMLCNNKLFLEETGEQRSVLLLITTNEHIMVPFSTLCAEFVTPGSNGVFRREIIDNPTLWWSQWKELLGNRNVDERVYDVLGELLTFLHLVKIGKEPKWNGPDGSTYDIDCGSVFFEVKSTTARKKREITLSNQYQLDPPEGKKLNLVFCQFESSIEGVSINSVLSDLENVGYSSILFNEQLEKLGLEKGRSARNRCYILHSMTEYVVDDNFPRITDSSFVGGEKPVGVLNYTYTVTLDSVKGRNLLEYGEKQ